MAKNYTFKEVVEIINAGTNAEAIAEIGKRFPILMLKTSKVCALAGEDFVDLMGYLPEHVTANKINSVIKGSVADVEEDVDGVEEVEEVTEDEATAKAEKDFSEMNNKELKAALRKAGFKSAEIKGKNKAAMLEMLNTGAPVAEEVEEAEEDEKEEADNSNPYEGKSAMELFKECKKRGIKAAPKKPAKFYIDLLMKADAEAAEEEADDDWEDEAPVKEEKKPTKKVAKKEVEEDDDWDI